VKVQPSKSSPTQWKLQYPAKILLASSLLAGLAWWGLYPNTFTTSMSYQVNTHPESSAPVALQSAMLKSAPVLNKVAARLQQQGLTGWTAQKLAQAVDVSMSEDTSLLTVTIETPETKQAQQIAQTLDQTYRQTLQQIEADRLEGLHKEVSAQMADTQARLHKGEADWKKRTGGFTAGSDAGNLWASDQALLSEYQEINRKLHDVQADLVSAQTHYRHYKGLLRQDEATLLKGVALGEDPVLQKLSSQLADAQKDSQIQSVGLTPADAQGESTHQARIEFLQSEVTKERARVLNVKQPVIRDSVRRGLVGDLIKSRIGIDSAKQTQKQLLAQRNALLKDLETAASTMAQTDAWTLEKRMLTEELHQLKKQQNALESQQTRPQTTVSVFEAPLDPVENNHTEEKSKAAAGVLAASMAILAALPLMIRKVDTRQTPKAKPQPATTLAQLTQALAQSPTQQVILMLPLSGDAYSNTSAHLGGLLNQCGRNTVVMDVDLTHRALSAQLNVPSDAGVLEHLINPSLKATVHEALSGADILPLETTITRQQVAEFNQIAKRLPRLFSRWPESLVLLDTPHWHEAYGELMPHVSKVVFYGAPQGQTAHQSAQLALPQILASQYGVPVDIVEA